ncbi:SLOG family protein [uncultured Pseudoflavonifractor sp.]|uniref:SLOG family protein n=1 Tax=uncultured Pseudoflavonifractor sp. TaxID=1221379 RepID=UPI0025FEE8C6|nr:SLOG family protein [uncultured Pseudoflavonifractor sp.]
MERETTCCFTGHRPDKLPWRDDEWDPRCVALKERLAAALEDAYNKGMRHFICGMARGADFYFCEAVLALRERRPGVTVEAALPCEEQAAHWKERDRNRYFRLVAQCDYETMVQHHYDRGCMLRRDRYMVDRSSMIIAVYGGVLGGTMYTLSYAMKKGLEVNILDVEI